VFVRGLHWGQGEREGSLAEKALFSSIFGNWTQKTLARVVIHLMEDHLLAPRHLWILSVTDDPLVMLKGCTVYRKSMHDFRVSRKRGKSLYKFVH
jgi:hypothetical protein